ncbi:glycosyltransferase family 2 protein [Mucilaginibacter sp.]
MKILIIIPCFNEQASLPNLIADLERLTLPEKYRLQLCVVNDCSTDNTSNVAQKLNVTLLDLPVNLGIGGAVQSGLKYALLNNYDLAVQMDGDGQHPPAELQKMIDCYEKTGASLVIGSRFLIKEGFQSSFLRRLGITYFHLLNKFFTGKSIYDSTSGFRLFDKKAIELSARYYPDDYPEPESLVFFSKAGLAIQETPVIMVHRTGGQSSIRSFTSFYYCVKVTLAMFFSFIRKS